MIFCYHSVKVSCLQFRTNLWQSISGQNEAALSPKTLLNTVLLTAICTTLVFPSFEAIFGALSSFFLVRPQIFHRQTDKKSLEQAKNQKQTTSSKISWLNQGVSKVMDLSRLMTKWSRKYRKCRLFSNFTENVDYFQIYKILQKHKKIWIDLSGNWIYSLSFFEGKMKIQEVPNKNKSKKKTPKSSVRQLRAKRSVQCCHQRKKLELFD